MTMDRFMAQSLEHAPGAIGGNALQWFQEHQYIISTWNRLFKINYFDFRAKIKDLAEDTFKDVTVIRGPEELREECLKEGDAYLVPIDDDDWISPRLAEALGKQTSTVVSWRMGPSRTSSSKRFSSLPQRFSSCNYAFKKSFVQQNPNTQKLLFYHNSSLRYAKSLNLDCVTFQEVLTYTNKTLASLVTLSVLWAKSSSQAELATRMLNEAARLAVRPSTKKWHYHTEQTAKLHRELLKPIYL